MEDLFTVYCPQEGFWEVRLSFGPHCFTLLNYHKEEDAADALRSILSNWNTEIQKRLK